MHVSPTPSLPQNIQNLIDTLFPTEDPHYKVTRDATELLTKYALDPHEWSHSAFMQMARDRGWSERTIYVRWTLFRRLVEAMSSHSPHAVAIQPRTRYAEHHPIPRESAPPAARDNPEAQAQSLMTSLAQELREAGSPTAAAEMDIAWQRGILVSFRAALEQMLIDMGTPIDNDQNLVEAIRRYALADKTLAEKMHTVRRHGNMAAHRDSGVTWDTVLAGYYAWKDVVTTLSHRSPSTTPQMSNEKGRQQ